LYYDGNAAVWYTYNQETQQYIPYVEPSNGVDGETTDVTKGTGDVRQNPIITAKADVVGLAPPVMVVNPDAEEGKKPTLAEAVAAAAEAAKLAAKKEKERMKEKEKEIRKAVTLGTAKKKINNALTLWKQRQHEGLTPSAAGDASVASVTTLEPQSDVDSTTIGGGLSNEAATRFHSDMFSQAAITPSKSAVGRGMALVGGGKSQSGDYQDSEVLVRARPISTGSSGLTAGRGSSVFGSSNSLFGDGAGPGRGSGRPSGGLEAGPSACLVVSGPVPSASGTPFKTNASALGSYSALAGTKRRFTESPQGGYRDRAAERRNLHGSTLPGDPTNETDAKEKGKEMPFPPGVGGRGIGAGRGSDMPFPPGVGGSTAIEGGVGAKSVVMAGPESHSFEVITAEKALDENNRGNRMLRNMGWQEGLVCPSEHVLFL
jgi:RNA-binding protein 5/10